MFPSRLALAALICLAPAAASAQAAAERAFVTALLNQLQDRSFAENREYCGYIGFDGSGRLTSGPVARGQMDSCEPQWPDNLDVIASFHTHAGFDLEAYSETPSSTDMEGDEADGVDGWVATPGGRLWYIDSTDMVTSQICGIGCLKRDPKFRPGVHGEIRQSYTYNELLRLEGN